MSKVVTTAIDLGALITYVQLAWPLIRRGLLGLAIFLAKAVGNNEVARYYHHHYKDKP